MRTTLHFRKLTATLAICLVAFTLALAGCKSEDGSYNGSNEPGVTVPQTEGPPTATPTSQPSGLPATPVNLTPPTPQG